MRDFAENDYGSVISQCRSTMVAILIIEVCGLYVLQFPLLYNFDKFAFWGWGAYLVAHHLFQAGYRPFSDFGWEYGLLPLFIQEKWFRVFSASPASFIALSLPCSLVFAIAIGKFADYECKALGRTLVLLSTPFVVALGADPTHALEPSFLSLGLLSQAMGRRGLALSFAVAASFTKPSMGYLFGLVLVIFMAVELRRHADFAMTDLIWTLVPAGCLALCLTLLLAVTFGWRPVAQSLLPLNGMRTYRRMHFGWRGNASGFFYFPGVKPLYYVGTPVGFWVCATIGLFIGLIFVSRLKVKPRNYALVLTCALLHLGFIGLFYGPPSSWVYYAFILTIGVAATDSWSPIAAKGLWALCILAALGNFGSFKSAFMAWKSMSTSASTAGLFAPTDEIAEWNRVIALVKDKNPAMFAGDGGAEVLFPWLQRPVGAFIVPGAATDGEIHRKVDQLRSSNVVVIPTVPMGDSFADWPGPEFQDVLKGKTLIFNGAYFQIYATTKKLRTERSQASEVVTDGLLRKTESLNKEHRRTPRKADRNSASISSQLTEDI
jgi:hypothetical protein